MKLIIVHYHLRPGGIRRIIELATPHLVREAPCPITRIVLATGHRADPQWHADFAGQFPAVPVEIFEEPAFNYLSEQRTAPSRVTARLQRRLASLLAGTDAQNCLVWAHNLGLGRNLLLTRELIRACAARQLPFVAHHHDWWFDNRWARWADLRRVGFRTLSQTARAIFPSPVGLVHAAINRADAAILARHFGQQSCWLPNLAAAAPPPPPPSIRAARHWLRGKLAGDDAPVWLLPCRSLRRKNLAEALLLTRWLRPEAWLVVTGTASSADEQPYVRALTAAARRHHWRLRLGVLAGQEARPPEVASLLAASEAVLLTSIQEGFGLPYLEAAAAQRPLIARRLPNIAPDLASFGFRFPQAYDDLLIAPGLFDWRAEWERQTGLFHAWRSAMPASVRRQMPRPALLAATKPCAIPFSRLTLSAQLEVLTCAVAESWAACEPLNPFLKTWRQRAAAGRLQVPPWPRQAHRWLGGKTYAQNFFNSLTAPAAPDFRPPSPPEVQADFIKHHQSAHNLYPLLWSRIN